MKRISVITFLLLSMFPACLMAKEKASTGVDLTNVHRIFLGWVAVDANYHKLGYSTREEWDAVVRRANSSYQDFFRSSSLGTGREVVAAKGPQDTKPEGYDLYINPANVNFDYKYRLHFAADFIDGKTGAALGRMDPETYGAHFCAMEGCMHKELEKAIEDLTKHLGTKH